MIKVTGRMPDDDDLTYAAKMAAKPLPNREKCNLIRYRMRAKAAKELERRGPGFTIKTDGFDVWSTRGIG